MIEAMEVTAARGWVTDVPAHVFDENMQPRGEQDRTGYFSVARKISPDVLIQIRLTEEELLEDVERDLGKALSVAVWAAIADGRHYVVKRNPLRTYLASSGMATGGVWISTYVWLAHAKDAAIGEVVHPNEPILSSLVMREDRNGNTVVIEIVLPRKAVIPHATSDIRTFEILRGGKGFLRVR